MDNTKLNGKSIDIVEENKEILKKLFPEIVTENKISFDKLKTVLGEEIEDKDEFYEFTWEGKKDAYNQAQIPITKTLRPKKEDSKQWDTTENLYIEGDNLEALKILEQSYRNKIKMIYIDPPYNTGNDFIYNDKWNETTEEHYENTNQLSEEGFKKSTNPKTDGRFHSKWLNMMYPRLILSKRLLKDDGVIFISIDDNEIENLKKICNEIFGEGNFIGQYNWNKSETPPNLSKKIKKNLEYILVYEKHKNSSKYKGIIKKSKSDNGLLNQTNTEKTLIFPKNIVKTNLKDGVLKKGEYGTDNYKIFLEKDTEVKNNIFIKEMKLRSKFKWNQEKLIKEIENKTIISIKTKTLSPSYEKQQYDPEVPSNLINKSVNVETTENAGKYLKKIFDNKKIFDYPKPVSLIKYLHNFLKTSKSEIILDFFSGTSTTAQAIIENNIPKENDKFIMVQLPEPCDEKSEAYKAGYKNICEIGKERIRRAGDEIVKESKNENLDIGFKVFKVDESNFIPWNPQKYDNIEEAVFENENNLVYGRTELDFVYELILKMGLKLTVPIEEKEINNHLIYIINRAQLLICLDNTISESIVQDLAKIKKDYYSEDTSIILKDEGLTDSLKLNIFENLKANGITNLKTI